MTNNRLISELPDDIVMSSILSLLPFEQVARTSVLSRHWYHSWQQCSSFDFKSSRSINCSNFEDERCKFVNCINNVIRKHIGSVINQFSITFDLINDYRSHINNWLVWAFDKHVKILELDFVNGFCMFRPDFKFHRYELDHTIIENCLKVKPLLTSLCLKTVNVTTRAVELLLVSGCCSTLENLCIEYSEYLTSIKACGSSSLLSLKYFKVYRCFNIETIEINAPKLLSFAYDGRSLRQFHIANASSLSHVSFVTYQNSVIASAVDSLSNYFPQLEYLKLGFFRHKNLNLSVDIGGSVLANLKHLQLTVFGKSDQTIFGWIPLLMACPLLEKLTLQVFSSWRYRKPFSKEVKSDRYPLRCLKTLEIIGYVGSYLDLEFVNFVFANGTALQEVIVEPYCDDTEAWQAEAQERASRLEVPAGVKIRWTPSP